MQIQQNHFKQALKEGRLQIGLWSSLCSNIAVEVIGDSGFDWILIDSEHAPNELSGIVSQLQALSAAQTKRGWTPWRSNAFLMLEHKAFLSLLCRMKRRPNLRSLVCDTRLLEFVASHQSFAQVTMAALTTILPMPTRKSAYSCKLKLQPL